MAFAPVRITPGVKQLQTPTLLQANIIASNLIRWRGGLPEKIGGWLQFYGFPINKIVRNLWAWADLSGVDHLATGGDGGVYVITNGAASDISPQYAITNNTPNFSTTSGSALVSVVDVSFSPSINAGVFIEVHVTIAGLTIYDMCKAVDKTMKVNNIHLVSKTKK